MTLLAVPRHDDAYGLPLAGLGAVNHSVADESDEAADSLFRCGMMHLMGDGVPVDLVAAHKWFNLAALRGDTRAVRLRREIAADMTPSEIAAAQRAARDWQLMRRGDRAEAD